MALRDSRGQTAGVRLQRRRPGPGSLVYLLLALTIALTACLGGDDGQQDMDIVPTEVGGAPVISEAGTGTLVCSQECRDRGQCGDRTDRVPVVLLDRAEPTVQQGEHDLAIPGGTAVTVLDQRNVTVVETTSGFEFPVVFYRVFVADQTVEGWVAPWCIEGVAQ